MEVDVCWVLVFLDFFGFFWIFFGLISLYYCINNVKNERR